MPQAEIVLLAFAPRALATTALSLVPLDCVVWFQAAELCPVHLCVLKSLENYLIPLDASTYYLVSGRRKERK